MLKLLLSCRYLVQQSPVFLVASETCQAQHPQPQQQAAACNMQLVVTWPRAAAAAAAGQQAYCVMHPTGELLTPSILRALTEGEHVVTPAWIEAVSGQKAWAGELPSVDQHRPEHVLLPAQQEDGSEGALHEQLLLSEWTAAEPTLLSGYMLLFGHGCQVTS